MNNVKTDLHNHLGRNGKFSNFNNVINIAHKNLGEGGIFGITKTSSGESWERYKRFVDSPGYKRDFIGDGENLVYVPEKDVYVISLQEISTEQGHLLSIGLPEKTKVDDEKPLEYSLEKVRESGGISVLPHSYGRKGAGEFLEENLKLLEFLCGYEVYNGSSALWIPKIFPRDVNRRAQEFYERIKNDYNIGAVSFTDGHNEKVIGMCSTGIAKISKEEFFNSLERGIRNNKDERNLIKRPNKLDAFKHAVNMASGKAIFS